jgi:hypothetical protein
MVVRRRVCTKFLVEVGDSMNKESVEEYKRDIDRIAELIKAGDVETCEDVKPVGPSKSTMRLMLEE